MARMRSAVLIVAVCVAAGCGTTRGVRQAERLGPCKIADGPADADCGLVTVWENRQAAAGRRIELKIIVLRALKSNSSADPVFVLAGGPGQGAADLVDTWQQELRPVQRQHDLVLVDARGTGASHPIRCAAASVAGDGPGATVRADILRECLASYRGYADVTQYTTESAMEDLDDVRAFLGYSTIDLYGVSYGTRGAIEYLRLHPDRVRAVVLDSVVPPENHLPSFIARDSQRAFDLLVGDCDRDARCRARFPNLKAGFYALLARLSKAPETVHYRNPVTGLAEDSQVTRSRVARIVVAALYAPELTSAVPLVIDQAEHGDFSGLFAIEDSTRRTGVTVSFGLQYSVLCSEDVGKIGGRTSGDATGTFLGDDAVRSAEALCALWPAAPIDTAYWRPVKSSIPGLLISGEIDPVAPPSWADVAAAQWPGVRRLVVPGASHNASAFPCVVDVIAQFLDSRNSAAIDTGCIDRNRRLPFLLDSSSPTAFAATAFVGRTR